jgi:hypothetical protein
MIEALCDHLGLSKSHREWLMSRSEEIDKSKQLTAHYSAKAAALRRLQCIAFIEGTIQNDARRS